MMNLHHPDDERLSGLASHDDDATSDQALASHVASCARCTDLVSELGALRVSLADLPDLRPPRPLQLVPAAADAPATGSGPGWVRRLFAPALAAGAALAMVGMIGTATPALDQIASGGGGFQDAGSEALGDPDVAEHDGEGVGAPAAEPSREPGSLGAAGADGDTDRENGNDDEPRTDSPAEELPAERSPWPMVLFTGVALMVGAAMLRWILVPRAG